MSVSGLPQAYHPMRNPIVQPQQEREGDPLQIIKKNESTKQEDQVSISTGVTLP
jgi:hypothetical protein